MSKRYIVTPVTGYAPFFGRFADADEATAKAAQWTDEYGMAWMVTEAESAYTRPPEPWYAHIFRWLLGR